MRYAVIVETRQTENGFTATASFGPRWIQQIRAGGATRDDAYRGFEHEVFDRYRQHGFDFGRIDR